MQIGADMDARDMEPGQLYRLPDGDVVEFSAIGLAGLVIVHPPGEPDMQSSYCIDPAVKVAKVAS